MPKLILIDADFTLLDVERDFALRPGVTQTLARLKAQANGPHIAIVTNQGGPACRTAGWDWSAKYPDLPEIETRYNTLAADLDLPLYLSLAYITSQGDVLLPPGVTPDDPRANPAWRWPAAGLFIQAMRDFGIRRPGEVLLVTTQDKAKCAARSLRIPVADGQPWFNQPARPVSKPAPRRLTPLRAPF
ncbi:MAG: hypothetical protein FOGNACKC_05529 [Anaerolineae bacterium]|nr:hypothetical protein [Anaerolineae bacterium]